MGVGHTKFTASPAFPSSRYQCRLLFAAPIAVNATQIVHGSMRFVASAKTSYTVTMTLNLDGTNITSTNKINLQVTNVVTAILFLLLVVSSKYAVSFTSFAITA
jgi:hypothetical protein